MKIRTDFVTNSSSYSSAEIMIDNPVLLEILARYQDMGLIIEESSATSIGSGGFNLPPPEMEIEIPDEKRGFSTMPAFNYYVEEGAFGYYPPSSLEDVIGSIIEILDYEKGCTQMDEDLIEQLKTELEQKREDINKSFERVYWENSCTSNEHSYENVEGYADDAYTFLYDRKNGERYIHIARNADNGEIILEE